MRKENGNSSGSAKANGKVRLDFEAGDTTEGLLIRQQQTEKLLKKSNNLSREKKNILFMSNSHQEGDHRKSSAKVSMLNGGDKEATKNHLTSAKAASATATAAAAAAESNNDENDIESASSIKQTKKNYCCFGRGARHKGKFSAWLTLLLSMLFLSVLIISLIAISFVPILQNEPDDLCHKKLSQFQQTTYKLFGTKTIYSTTNNILNSINQQRRQHQNSQQDLIELSQIDKNNFYSSQRELPNLFNSVSASITTRELHEYLKNNLNCKLRQLHYLGRHAARFPNSDSIVEIKKLIENIQNRIDLSKYPQTVAIKQQDTTAATTTPSNQQVNNSTNLNSTQTICEEPNYLAQFKQWSPDMIPEQGNLVLDHGMAETDSIARRFKSIYPEMFDEKSSQIKVSVTSELRTAQTATAFLKHFENIYFESCEPGQFPLDGFSDKSRVEEIISNKCYRSLIRKNRDPRLEFHKYCDGKYKYDLPIDHNLRLRDPVRVNFIAESVSKLLELVPNSNDHHRHSTNEDGLSSNHSILSSEEVGAIYKICKHETAALGGGQSIWCNLFTDQELKYMEYMEDVDDFMEVYAHPDQARTACAITAELTRNFKSANQNSSVVSSFAFTHSEVIRKVLALIVDLENDDGYSASQIRHHLDSHTIPESRKWRSSLISPFSANIAFTLYECPKTSDGGAGGSKDSSEFKLITSLNERPIIIDGCSNFVCNLDVLLDDSRLAREKRCKTEEICRNKIVVT